MPKTQRVAYAIAKHLPNAIIKEPERLFIGAAAVILGIMVLNPFPPYDARGLATYAAYMVWGIGFIVGGLSKIFAVFLITSKQYQESLDRIKFARAFEELATSLIGLCAIVWAILAWGRGSSALSIIVFSLLALTNIIRLVVSLAGYVPLYRGSRL